MSGSPDVARGPLHPKPAGTDTNARPKVGDRVRVVIEGPVFRDSGAVLEVGNIQSRFTVPSGTVGIPGGTVSVEILPPPEPAWRAGDVVIAGDGSIYTRRSLGDDIETYPWLDGGWLIDGHGGTDRIKDGHIPRPLTLLVRAGKPVK